MAFAQEKPTGLEALLPAGATVHKLAGGMQFVEGAAWTDGDGGYLIFSDIPASELKKWDGHALTTFRRDTHNSNGNTFDLQGRLITCEHTTRRVVRAEKDGTLNILADHYDGRKLNSPNDVIVKSDGTIWFSDPSYGIPGGQKQELAGHFVFRLDPSTKTLTKVAEGFDQPNGLCFSPDEKHLYIADSGKKHYVRVFDVHPDNTLSGGEQFCVVAPGVPDGMRCDEHGNLWSSAGDGIQVFDPAGKRIGKIPVPETPANLSFGGKDGRTLFITARTSLYSIPTHTRSATNTKKN